MGWLDAYRRSVAFGGLISETYFALVKEAGVWVMATIYRDEEHKRLKETVYANGRIEVRRKK